MDKRSTCRALAALLLAAAGAGTGAHAQEFPTRPIRWIVPYLPGTGPDTTVRTMAEAMGELLRQPVVVENKAGAAGNLGARIAASAAPDGYTWVYSGSPMSTSMRMYRKPGYDVLRDFVHVGRISTSDTTLVVAPDSGITSAQALIERARRAPGKLTYASGGVGTPSHMGTELMLEAAGVQALHVPHKGATESVNAVLGKQVDFSLSLTPVVLKLVGSGKLTALAVSGTQRNALLPHVPTLAEEGFSGVTLVSFGGLSVPAGTPAPIVRRIADALDRALAMPAVRARLEALGGSVAPSTADEYAKLLREEITLTERMMKTAGIEPQ